MFYFIVGLILIVLPNLDDGFSEILWLWGFGTWMFGMYMWDPAADPPSKRRAETGGAVASSTPSPPSHRARQSGNIAKSSTKRGHDPSEIEAVKKEFRYLSDYEAINILNLRKGTRFAASPAQDAAGSGNHKLPSRPAQASSETKTDSSHSLHRENKRPRPQEKEKRTQSSIKRQKAKIRAEAYTHFRTEKGYQKQRKSLPGCPYCDTLMPSFLSADVELDHIYPAASGGRNLARNLVFVCRPCNQMKSNHGLNEFCMKSNKDVEAISKKLLKLGKRI